jgi:hypothetical protein
VYKAFKAVGGQGQGIRFRVKYAGQRVRLRYLFSISDLGAVRFVYRYVIKLKARF